MTTTKEPTALASLDADFHAAVAQASGNKLFVAVLAQIRGALARQSETLTVIARRRDDSNREHQAIVDAIADGSAERAKAAMASHLDAVSASVSGLMQASPGPSGDKSGDGAAPDRFDCGSLSMRSSPDSGYRTGHRGLRCPDAQSPITARNRVAKCSGSSTNPMCPPGNIVGTVSNSFARAFDVRSQT